MSDQHGWLPGEAVDMVLADLQQLITDVSDQVHQAHGEEQKPVRHALLQVTFRLQESEQRMQATLSDGVALGVAAVPTERPEPHEVTGEVLRRIRKNAGGPARHRAKP